MPFVLAAAAFASGCDFRSVSLRIYAAAGEFDQVFLKPKY
jgi:hypothetical protein